MYLIIFVFAHNFGLNGVQTCARVLCANAQVCVRMFELSGLAALVGRIRFGHFSNESEMVAKMAGRRLNVSCTANICTKYIKY